MSLLLEVTDAHSYYGSNHVLFGVNLNVREGEVVVLLGRNGAGKTTTLKGIMGVHRFRSGRVRFRCEEIGMLEVGRGLPHRTGLCPGGLPHLQRPIGGRKSRGGASAATCWPQTMGRGARV